MVVPVGGRHFVWFTLAPLVSALPRDLVIVGEESVVLVELNIVEQRYRAVLDVLEGASVVEVAPQRGEQADGA